jgi:hypothetical protein
MKPDDLCDCGHSPSQHWTTMGPLQMYHPGSCRECACAGFNAEGVVAPWIVEPSR